MLITPVFIMKQTGKWTGIKMGFIDNIKNSFLINFVKTYKDEKTIIIDDSGVFINRNTVV